MNKTPETPPPSAAFSFKVKSLLLEITASTTTVEACLEKLTQGNETRPNGSTEDALMALEDAAKEFYAISHLNLLTLSWLAASLELTDREIVAVGGLKERVMALAGHIKKEPLRSRQDTKTAFRYISKVEWNLEESRARMQLEEKAARAKARLRDEAENLKKRNRIIWAIAISLLSGLLGSTLG